LGERTAGVASHACKTATEAEILLRHAELGERDGFVLGPTKER
jgi:hypothetical protein